jgi:hypothetical protein
MGMICRALSSADECTGDIRVTFAELAGPVSPVRQAPVRPDVIDVRSTVRRVTLAAAPSRAGLRVSGDGVLAIPHYLLCDQCVIDGSGVGQHCLVFTDRNLISTGHEAVESDTERHH